MGSGSARAGLVTNTENGGKLIKYHSEEILTYISPTKPDFFEQSTKNIWEKVCECVKLVSHDVPKSEILGIGFAATCSLSLFDKNLEPLTSSPTLDDERNVIMWMDHRAQNEANFINEKCHDILKYVGGRVSLEMEIPKLLWLKNNLNESFQKIYYAFDLPDFLTWRATGMDTRSICSLTCKWNYDAVNSQWPVDFFESIGLKELTKHDFRIIGKQIKFPGECINSLSKEAAEEMGLLPSTAVGCSMIDAHAGAIGLLGSSNEDITSKLILIAGTSTCHMSITSEMLFSPGIWGPYRHALLPNYYLHEAGQSAAGILIDYIIKTHPDYEKLRTETKNIYDQLYDGIMLLSSEQGFQSFHELTEDFHVYPDFHGNRSPLADSTMRGLISGLSMHDSIYVCYLAIIQALAYSTKHIIESLYKSGRKQFENISICGGLSKNRLYVSTHSDVCGIPVFISNEPESVLLGSSMLGAAASGYYPNLETAIKELSSSAIQITPNLNSFNFHERKYKIFLKMLDDQKSYKNIMNAQ